MPEPDPESDAAPQGAPVPDAGPSPLRVALTGVLLLASLLPVARFLQIALLRIDYPFDLEWMEGGMVDHVARVVGGDVWVYGPPNVESISFLYTPLYYHLAALVAQVMGVSHFTLRVISLASTLVCFALIFQIARRLGGSALAGGVTVGLMAATYPLGGFWFDLARVDMLWLALLLSAYALYVRLPDDAPSPGATIAVGLVWAAAFWTKQFSIAILGLIVVADLFASPRRAVGVAAVAGVTSAVLVGVTQIATDGWMLFYTFSLPAQHPIVAEHVAGFWTRDLIRFPLPLLATSAALSLVVGRSAWRTQRLPLAFVVGLVLSAYSARIHSGGWVNTLIPAHLALSLGVAWLLGLAPALQARWLPATALLCLLQFFLLLGYDPGTQIPNTADRARGEAILEQIRATGQDTFVASQGFLSTRATGHMHAHYQSIWDVARSSDERAKALYRESLAAWKATPGGVVLESNGGPCDDVRLSGVDGYAVAYEVRYRGFEFFPRTGCPTRPAVAYAVPPLD